MPRGGNIYFLHLPTGTLKFGKIDVTEEQFCVITLYLIGAVFGSDIWNVEVRPLGRVRSGQVIEEVVMSSQCGTVRSGQGSGGSGHASVG